MCIDCFLYFEYFILGLEKGNGLPLVYFVVYFVSLFLLDGTI